MKTVVSLVLALFVGQTPVFALEPQRLDVRDMKDWSIVVSKDALESERYAAEEFRDFFALATGHRLMIGGESTDSDYPTSHRVTPADLGATLLHLAGFDPLAELFDPLQNRPRPVCEGTVIEELL